MLLEFRDIHFRFSNKSLKDVINGFSMEVRAGEVVTIIGPNGAGKSSLLAIAHGALKPQKGAVLFEGRPVAEMSRREIAGHMALVSQASDVRFPLTALEYVLTGRFAHAGALGFDSPVDVETSMRALVETDAAQFAQRPFNELSSGERQRVVLARALAQEPRLLLLDEPTANADLSHQISLLSLVKKLTRERNLGAIVVTHEINLASEFGDRVALMKDGRLLACGNPQDALTDSLLSGLFQAQLIVDQHPLSGKPRVSWAVTADV